MRLDILCITWTPWTSRTCFAKHCNKLCHCCMHCAAIGPPWTFVSVQSRIARPTLEVPVGKTICGHCCLHFNFMSPWVSMEGTTVCSMQLACTRQTVPLPTHTCPRTHTMDNGEVLKHEISYSQTTCLYSGHRWLGVHSQMAFLFRWVMGFLALLSAQFRLQYV